MWLMYSVYKPEIFLDDQIISQASTYTITVVQIVSHRVAMAQEIKRVSKNAR